MNREDLIDSLSRIDPMDNQTNTTSYEADVRLPRVIDAEFRQPAAIAQPIIQPMPIDTNTTSINLPYTYFNTSCYTVPSYTASFPDDSNVYDSSRLESGSLINTTSTVQTTDVDPAITTFATPIVASSFADLARKQEELSGGVDPLRSTLIDSTLNEYGPAFSSSSEPSQTSSNTTNQVAKTGSNSDETTNSGYSAPYSSETSGYSSAVTPYTQTELIYSTEKDKDQQTNGASFSAEPGYSALDTSSPPLDTINNTLNSVVDKVSSNEANNPVVISTGKIPKKSSSSTNDHLDHFSLVELQKKYRECETDQKANNQAMQSIERYLNDMQRSSHGRNIELDPMFRQKKDEQKKCLKTAQDLKADINSISTKLFEKYQFRMTPLPPTKRGPPHRQRAKMSTGGGSTASPKEDARDHLRQDPQNKKYLLKYSDSRTWCELCDLHFDTLNGYCDHLHQREHQRRMNKTEPWRVMKESVSKRKTFDLIKSVCSKIEHDLKNKFNQNTLTSCLVPSHENKAEYLRDMNVSREKSEFQEDDPLMTVKGYHYLIPVTGYFCTLCNRTMCDMKSVDQHMRSYEHTYYHAKSVALNPQHETNFRINLEKSYKRQYKPVQERSKTSKNASSSNSARLPLQQYKKPTSRIVDEHETVINKFTQRTTVNSGEAVKKVSDTRKRPLIEIDSDEETPKTNELQKKNDRPSGRKEVYLPEIVPVGSRSKPSALKRLRPGRNQVDIPAPARAPSPSPSPSPTPVETTTNTVKETDTLNELETATETMMEALAESPDIEYIECDDDYQTPCVENDDEYSLAQGDLDSPFPELTLRITGNAHLNQLKDKRLAAPCRVVLKKIDINDYKDMLLDETTLWSRMFQLLTKKEPTSSPQKKLRKEPTKTQASFFSATGGEVPIELERKNSVNIKDEKSKSPSDSDLFSVGPTRKPELDMTFLQDFFCEK